MQRCIDLASKGLGKTRANPLVGSVIVYNGIIIGEGYHHEYGGPHAEVNAIDSVRDKSLLKKSTLYVNLEPCSHYGKTPPCSLLIKDHGIPTVVIGSTDPNPQVSGKGIDFLAGSGIKVIKGIMESECRWINKRFYTFHEEKRPYVILKWAKTKDGYIDNRGNNDFSNPPLRITNNLSQMLVHKWRSEEMAIMAGPNTINMDNPSLNVRYWKGENPVRFTFEGSRGINPDSKILTDGGKTIVYSRRKSDQGNWPEYKLLNEDPVYPDAFLKDMYERNILSLLVEGGRNLHDIFLRSDLWDEARVFTGNVYAYGGTHAPSLNKNGLKLNIAGDELMVITRKNH